MYLSSECRHVALNEKARVLGHCCSVMFKSPVYARYRIFSMKVWLEQAIEHQQIIVFFDCYSNAVGYITWALLEEETENRYLNDDRFTLHPSEWNEGERAWIIDACFPDNVLPQALPLIKKTLNEQGVVRISWRRTTPRGQSRTCKNYRL